MTTVSHAGPMLAHGHLHHTSRCRNKDRCSASSAKGSCAPMSAWAPQAVTWDKSLLSLVSSRVHSAVTVARRAMSDPSQSFRTTGMPDWQQCRVQMCPSENTCLNAGPYVHSHSTMGSEDLQAIQLQRLTHQHCTHIWLAVSSMTSPLSLTGRTRTETKQLTCAASSHKGPARSILSIHLLQQHPPRPAQHPHPPTPPTEAPPPSPQVTLRHPNVQPHLERKCSTRAHHPCLPGSQTSHQSIPVS